MIQPRVTKTNHFHSRWYSQRTLLTKKSIWLAWSPWYQIY